MKRHILNLIVSLVLVGFAGPQAQQRNAVTGAIRFVSTDEESAHITEEWRDGCDLCLGGGEQAGTVDEESAGKGVRGKGRRSSVTSRQSLQPEIRLAHLGYFPDPRQPLGHAFPALYQVKC